MDSFFIDSYPRPCYSLIGGRMFSGGERARRRNGSAAKWPSGGTAGGEMAVAKWPRRNGVDRSPLAVGTQSILPIL